jgi:hypothetical protein
MKNNIKQNIKAIILGLVLTLGIGYVAAQTTFTGPTCSPTADPGCNIPAPVNVGSLLQSKLGPLTLGGLGVVGDFKFIPTNLVPPTTGQVLMADDSDLASGKVKWGSVSGGGSGRVVTCSKTFQGSNGQYHPSTTYSASDCGGVIVDSTYYGATRKFEGYVSMSAQAPVQIAAGFETVNAGEQGGPGFKVFHTCGGNSCTYYVSSVYIKPGLADTTAGLIAGGFTCNAGSSNPTCSNGVVGGTVWGVANSNGSCPAAYDKRQTSADSSASYICLTK